MKSVYFLKINNGIALIEVLIATVVIATGLLSVASMQGSFIQSSSANKIRAEALTLAEQKIEQSRNNIVLADYSAIQAVTEYPINGINAVFKRILAISNPTSPTIKRIEVTVTWGDTAAEKVVLTSEIAFSDPGNSVGIAAYGTPSGQSPSPNQGASVGITDKTATIYDTNGNLKTGFVGVSGSTTLFKETATGVTYRLNIGGNTASVVFDCSNLVRFDVNYISSLNYDASGGLLTSPVSYLYTQRLNLDGVIGDEAIDLYTQNFITTTTNGVQTSTPDGTCTREHRFFGGVIISIKGTARTENNLDTIKIDFDKTDMFCVFNPGIGKTSRPYACYTGGNCNVSISGDNTNVNTCPSPSAADAKVGPGGFSGNVGLINVDDDGNGKESVCFQDELNEGPIKAPQTARKYKTINTSVNGEQGINRSYNCQDFYIVDRQPNFDKLFLRCSNIVGTVNLPPKEVIRSINGQNVVVNTTTNLIDTSYCNDRVVTRYILNVTLPSPSPSTSLVSTVFGPCADTNTTTHTAWRCTVNTSASSIEVFATFGVDPVVNNSSSFNEGSTIFTNLGPSNTTPITQSISMNTTNNTYRVNGNFSVVIVGNGNNVSAYKIQASDSYHAVDCYETNSSYTSNSSTFTRSTTSSSYYSCNIRTIESLVYIKAIRTNTADVISYFAQPIDSTHLSYSPSYVLTIN